MNNMHNGNMLNGLHAESLGMQQSNSQLFGSGQITSQDIYNYYRQHSAAMAQQSGLSALGHLYANSYRGEEKVLTSLSVNTYRSLDWDFSSHMQKIEDEIKNEK